jgi:hypothetical protein
MQSLTTDACLDVLVSVAAGVNNAITRDKLEMMLEAARWAPTHKLTEPWRFVVLAGASKAEFEELTIERCQALLPPEKAEQVVAKLKRKQIKDWPKVSETLFPALLFLSVLCPWAWPVLICIRVCLSVADGGFPFFKTLTNTVLSDTYEGNAFLKIV